MPGDPLRAKFIADNFLENPKLVNNVRGVQGYTGTYKGYPVSVMASGMGMPSMGIYSYELFNFFGVENIIRIGTTGGMQEYVKIRDIVVGISAHSDSNFQETYGLTGHIAPTASYDLIKRADSVGESLGLKDKMHFGSILSSDVYYGDSTNTMDWAKIGTLAVEMESAVLYMNAARAGKNALCICTVSNSLITGYETTAEERQSSFKAMMEVALGIAASYERDHPLK
ncbi:MAG: purine-nucleoside phosphorylase [archaeon]|nr:purine-nucleoside phosphorylase [archaeon]